MKLAVFGSRCFDDANRLAEILAELAFGEIVTGDATGVDKLARNYAKQNGIPLTVFKVEWDKYPGKSAAFHRNKQIVGASGGGVAVWDGRSRGTRMTMDLFRKTNKPLWVVHFDCPEKNHG